MRHKILTIAFIAAAVTLPLLTPHLLDGQTAPAGQVSRRMAAQSHNPDVVASAMERIHTDGKIARPAGTAAIAPMAVGTLAPVAGKQNVDADKDSMSNALGAASLAAWTEVVNLDSSEMMQTANAMAAARYVATEIDDTLGRSDAVKVARVAQSMATQAYGDDTKEATDKVIEAVSKLRCSYNTDGAAPVAGAKPKYQFEYRNWAPTWGAGCTNDAILNFFSVSGNADTANNVKYLYNAQQSTSQVNADLVTATFAPGYQVVFAGTATAGSSQPAAASTAASVVGRKLRPSDTTTPTSTSATDSVSTAVAKLEAGGDFNIRFNAPFLYHFGPNASLQTGLTPNLGFTINGFGSQSTITETTEYSFNLPAELYWQTKSIDLASNGLPSAVLFFDVKPAGELISTALKNKIGLTGRQEFFLMQASGGIEFAKSIRVSFQYIHGPEQIYQTTDSAGAATTTKSRIGGFHLAVSFSPQKSKS